MVDWVKVVWEPYGDEILKQKWMDSSVTKDQISRMVGLHHTLCTRRASELGFRKDRRQIAYRRNWDELLWNAGGDDLLRAQWPDPKHSKEDIYKRLGVSRDVVIERVKFLGLKRSPKSHPNYQSLCDQALELIKQGMSRPEVSRKLHISKGSLSGMIYRNKEGQVETRTREMVKTRDREIYRLRFQENWTIALISEKMNVSKERLYVILNTKESEDACRFYRNTSGNDRSSETSST